MVVPSGPGTQPLQVRAEPGSNLFWYLGIFFCFFCWWRGVCFPLVGHGALLSPVVGQFKKLLERKGILIAYDYASE